MFDEAARAVSQEAFLLFGRMDRRQDQMVLIEMRHASLVAEYARQIERQFGQEALARRITAELY